VLREPAAFCLLQADEDVAAGPRLAAGPSCLSIGTMFTSATAAAAAASAAAAAATAAPALQEADASTLLTRQAAAPAKPSPHRLPTAPPGGRAAAPLGADADAASVVSLGAQSAHLAESVYGGVKVRRLVPACGCAAADSTAARPHKLHA
jgi:hypothetical protein